MVLARSRHFYDYINQRCNQFASRFGVTFEFKGRVEKIASQPSNALSVSNQQLSASFMDLSDFYYCPSFDLIQFDSDSDSDSSSNSNDDNSSVIPFNHNTNKRVGDESSVCSPKPSPKSKQNRNRKQFFYQIKLNGNEPNRVMNCKQYLIRMMLFSAIQTYKLEGGNKCFRIESMVKSRMQHLQTNVVPSVKIDAIKLKNTFNVFILSDQRSDKTLINELRDKFSPIRLTIKSNKKTMNTLIKPMEPEIELTGRVSMYLDFKQEKVELFGLKFDEDYMKSIESTFNYYNSFN